jgi:hypothetical protein
MADTTPEVRPALGIPLFDRYDPRIVQEMAIGIDEEIDILARYRITGSAAEQLLTDPILRTEVTALTQELKRAGTTAKIKSRFVAEEIIGKLWEKIRQGAHTTGELLDVLKVLAKIGDLEPRETGGKLTGTIVRVDLNIGSLGFNPPPVRAVYAETPVPASAITPPPAAAFSADVSFVEVVDDEGLPGLAGGQVPAELAGLAVDSLDWVV